MAYKYLLSTLITLLSLPHINATPTHQRLPDKTPINGTTSAIAAIPNISPPLPQDFTKTLFTTSFSTQSLGSLPDPVDWSLDLGHSYPNGPWNWGTREIQNYTDSADNIAITPAGTLLITPLPPSEVASEWTSARIESTPAHDFSCPELGKLRMEASIKLGAAPENEQIGIWPAFWALGSGYRDDVWSWPGVSEIDIMESVNGMESIFQTFHCEGRNCGAGEETAEGVGRGEWHVYAVEINRTGAGDLVEGWRNESITWFIDGKETYRVTGDDVDDENAWARLAQDEKFLLLNVAVGGGMPDGISGERTPNERTVGGEGSAMEVGYVAVYASQTVSLGK